MRSLNHVTIPTQVVPNLNSLLPPEHPDYEPDLRFVSRVLFPLQDGDDDASMKKKRRRGRYAKVKKEKEKEKKAALDSSDEDDQGLKTPKGSGFDALLMAPGPPRRSKKGKIEDSW